MMAEEQCTAITKKGHMCCRKLPCRYHGGMRPNSREEPRINVPTVMNVGFGGVGITNVAPGGIGRVVVSNFPNFAGSAPSPSMYPGSNVTYVRTLSSQKDTSSSSHGAGIPKTIVGKIYYLDSKESPEK